MIVMYERQEVKSLKKALRALTFLNCHGESTVTEVAGSRGPCAGGGGEYETPVLVTATGR